MVLQISIEEQLRYTIGTKEEAIDVDVLFEGRLNPELQLKTVLQRVLENKPGGDLVVRITSAEQGNNGRLCIRDGRFITAALLDQSDESGYPALRRLLAVMGGNFTGLRPEQGEKIDLIPNLNFELHKVIPLMPHLPESPVGLFDEKSLLDKVFSTGGFEKLEQSLPTIDRSEIPLQEPQMPQMPPLSQMQMPPPMGASLGIQTPGQPIPSAQPQPWQLVKTVPMSPFTDDNDDERLKPPELPSYEGLEDLQNSNRKNGRIEPKHDAQYAGKPAARGATSPIIVIGLVLVLLTCELLAIVFWGPLNAYLAAKKIQIPGMPVPRRAPVHSHAPSARHH